MHRALIVVAKQPMPGRTKTRLSPPLTPEQAVELYTCFLLDTLDLMQTVGEVDCLLAYDPPESLEYFQGIAPEGFSFVSQVGGDLGQRLDHVLSACLTDGYEQAVVMNSDSPTLPVERLREAFHMLDDPTMHLVLGPSEDGGYYLIGLKRPCAPLFQVTMSTPTVLQETLAIARAQGLHSACLAPWYDVDTPEDLASLLADVLTLPAGRAPRTRALPRHILGPTDGRSTQ